MVQKKSKPSRDKKYGGKSEPQITHEEIVRKEPMFDPKKFGWVVFLFAVLLYANTFDHKYTVDDITVINGNSITQQGISGIPELLTTPYRKGYWQRKENLYRPLSMVMFAVEHQLAPGKPALSHVVNVLVYGLTGWMLYLLLLHLFTGSTLPALMAALLFVAHPLHTEVVANIKSRDELLSLLFCLAALYGWFRYVKREGAAWLLFALISYMLALFSKENSVTYMAVFPLAAYFFSKEKFSRIVFLTSWFLIPLAFYFTCRYWVLRDLGAYDEVMLINNSLVGASNFGERMATAVSVLGRYMWLLLVPLTLVSDYSYNQIPVVGWDDAGALFSLLVICILVVVAFRKLDKRSVISFSIFYFFITLSVVANVVFLIESAMGERFVYMPSVGFALLAGWLLVKMLAEKRDRSFAGVGEMLTSNSKLFIAAGLILALYGFRTVTRNADWKDNLTLLEADVKNSPNSAREQYAFGAATVVERAWDEPDAGKKERLLEQGINHLLKAVEIWPEYADAYNMLGKAYLKKEDAAAAVRAFDRARALKNFNDASFYSDASLAYFSAKQYDKAIADIQRAISLDPKAESYSNLGMYLTESGRPAEALEPLQKSVAMNPDFAKAHYNLGLAYARMNNYDEAIPHFQKAVELNPSSEENLNNLGNCYAAKQDYEKALEYFLRVEQLNPGNTMVLKNIGFTYRNLGRFAEAEAYFQKAGGL